MTGPEELGWAGIEELAARLRARTLSPVELCRVLLARAERLEPRLNAFITLAPERVLAEARVAEAELLAGRVRGPLHGVPVAVKDLCWTRGERTTGGSKILADFVPDEDASVVARLRAAGAIMFGKTNTPEFAYGPLNAYHYGPSRNPWDTSRFTGGSSMGAAAALAAGVVPGAIGSDTGGSIRGPAHWSGVTGLKPTYGRVPLRGVVALATSLDHVGPMARSALDAALLLQGMAGYDPADPTSADVPVPDYAREVARSARGLRVGVPRGFLWDELPPAIATVVERALGEWRRLGLILEDVELPEWEAAAEATLVLIRCEAVAEYRKVLARPRKRPAPRGPGAPRGGPGDVRARLRRRATRRRPAGVRPPRPLRPGGRPGAPGPSPDGPADGRERAAPRAALPSELHRPPQPGRRSGPDRAVRLRRPGPADRYPACRARVGGGRAAPRCPRLSAGHGVAHASSAAHGRRVPLPDRVAPGRTPARRGAVDPFALLPRAPARGRSAKG